MRPDLHERNRISWNAATVAHNRHKGDQAAFLRAGGTTLFDEERDLLGAVAGLDVVHLQCNAGQDTLSIGALGARVTGVDISDEAISFARTLSRDSGIEGRFVRADVYDWLKETPPGSFDVAFASYGALIWLSDIGEWARGVAAALRPGGRLVVVEFHPVGLMFDRELRWTWPYSSGGAPSADTEGVNDYVAEADTALTWGGAPVAEPFVNPHPAACFEWGLGDVLGALIRSGLVVRRFEEWTHSNGFKPFSEMRALPGRRWALPEGKPAIPLMYGVVATAAG